MNQITELVGPQRDVLLATFSFLCGAFAGHRFTLLRDRRKEFNDACQPLRKWAIEEAARPSLYHPMPSRADWDLLEQRMGRLQRRRLSAALKAHDEVRRQQIRQDTVGQVLYRDAEPIRASARRILDELKLR